SRIFLSGAPGSVVLCPEPPNTRHRRAMRGPKDTRAIVTALPFGQRGDNLPAEVTRFIGRRRELPAIAGAVERHRLVTLRGAGGVGKTRLALRGGARLPRSFTHRSRVG